jgi:AcrR family transcriptional regulator
MVERLHRKRRGAYHHGDLERAMVEAAVHMIQEAGVPGLTLREVGARLGVSRTALYRHFDDKAALVARVAAEGFRLFHETLARAVAAAAADGGDPLQAMAGAYVDFALANRSHYETMFGGYLENWGRYPDLIEHADKAFGILLNTIRDEQRNGRIGPGDPVEIAEITWSLSHGIATLGAARHLTRTPTSVRDLAVMGCRFLQNGVLGEQAPKPSGPRSAEPEACKMIRR